MVSSCLALQPSPKLNEPGAPGLALLTALDRGLQGALWPEPVLVNPASRAAGKRKKMEEEVLGRSPEAWAPKFTVCWLRFESAVQGMVGRNGKVTLQSGGHMGVSMVAARIPPPWSLLGAWGRKGEVVALHSDRGRSQHRFVNK